MCARLGEGSVAPNERGWAGSGVDRETIGGVDGKVESIYGIAPFDTSNGIVVCAGVDK